MKRRREEIIDELQIKRAKLKEIEREEIEVNLNIKHLNYELN